jgi:signal transduction histidine kinase
MRERAVLIGATLKLSGSPLGGTRVTLELPAR